MFDFKRINAFLLFGGIFLALITTIVLLAKPLFIVLFVSVLLSVLLKPLSNKFSKKFPETLSIVLSLFIFIMCFIGFLIFVTGNILPALTGFIKDIPTLSKDITSFSTLLSTNFPWIGSEVVVQEQTSQFIQSVIDWSVSFAKASLIPLLKTTSNIAEMIGIPIITFYFMKDSHKGIIFFKKAFPNISEEIEMFFDKIMFMLGKYIQGQLLVSILSGISVMIVGMFLGVKHIFLFAFLSALGEWIPVLGPIFAAILAVSTIMVQDPGLSIKLAIFYIIMFKINHNIVYPALVGKATKLHPSIIMIGVLFAGHVAGAFGMLIIVPTLATIYIYFSLIQIIQKKQ